MSSVTPIAAEAEQNPTTIDDVIKSVFIDPIRSVLLIDDEYPTLDKVLKAHKSSGRPWEDIQSKIDENQDRMLSILDYCRHSDRNWMVDVHDGVNVKINTETKTAKNLRHSDLLFLDYFLEGKGSDAKKCIDILEVLSNSKHFNLVVIVTDKDKDEAFNQILFNFIGPKLFQTVNKKFGDIEIIDQVAEKVDEWSDLVDGRIKEELEECLGESTLIELSKFPVINARNPNVKAITGKFEELFEKKPENIGVDLTELLNWSIYNITKRFSQIELPVLENSDPNQPINWLCCKNLFMTIENKSDDGLAENLMSVLQKALTDWNPTTNRLILSKLRSEIEEKGLSAGADVFFEKNMHAFWLKNLVGSDVESQKTKVDDSIFRYGESLIESVIPEVRRLALDSLKIEKEGPIEARIKKSFNIDINCSKTERLAALEHNVAISNKPVGGWHFQPGHIFKYEDDYWICLTPACDLVPKQPRKRAKGFEKLMPFNAVKMNVVPDKQALTNAQENLNIFFYDNNNNKELLSLHITVDGAAKSQVQWQEFFAKGLGEFEPNTFNSEVTRIKYTEDDEFKGKWQNIEIVAQLRYEYAINLMQVLAQKTSRIGLDYMSGPADVDQELEYYVFIPGEENPFHFRGTEINQKGEGFTTKFDVSRHGDDDKNYLVHIYSQKCEFVWTVSIDSSASHRKTKEIPPELGEFLRSKNFKVSADNIVGIVFQEQNDWKVFED